MKDKKVFWEKWKHPQTDDVVAWTVTFPNPLLGDKLIVNLLVLDGITYLPESDLPPSFGDTIKL